MTNAVSGSDPHCRVKRYRYFLQGENVAVAYSEKVSLTSVIKPADSDIPLPGFLPYHSWIWYGRKDMQTKSLDTVFLRGEEIRDLGVGFGSLATENQSRVAFYRFEMVEAIYRPFLAKEYEGIAGLHLPEVSVREIIKQIGHTRSYVRDHGGSAIVVRKGPRGVHKEWKGLFGVVDHPVYVGTALNNPRTLSDLFAGLDRIMEIQN